MLMTESGRCLCMKGINLRVLKPTYNIQWRYIPTGLWPTERPPPVSETNANFCGQRGVTLSAQRIPTDVNLCLSNLDRYLFYSSSSSIDLTRLTRLSVPRSRPNATQKIWQRRESNPRPLYLQPETLTTRLQRRSYIQYEQVYLFYVKTGTFVVQHFSVHAIIYAYCHFIQSAAFNVTHF